MILACLLAVLGVVAPGRAVEPQVFPFHHDDVLGTSLDLQVQAPDATQAAAAEAAILAEIERLRKILSTYDPASDVSKVNTTAGPVACPPELLEVLGFYDFWTAKSRGAYNGHLGELISTWKAAEKAGAPPTPAVLQPIVRSLALPGWKLDLAAHTVTRLTTGTLDINSLGKGYIISKAIVAARTQAPAAKGILLNVGGDIFASGSLAPGVPWTVGVANPMHNEDNAPPLTQVKLIDRAISTSAAYERGYTFAGKHYSHIFDPRTGYPAGGIASATVITGNSANANALATTLCVLRPEEGLELVRQIPDTDCLIVGADGRLFRSPRFATYEIPRLPVAPAVAPAANPGSWPAKYQVTISITLKTPPPGAKPPRRPYVAVWVEDPSGKRVRTVAVWGKAPKYLPDLIEWWKQAQQDQQWASTVTKATRPAGQYRLAWDGLDDQGKPLPSGTYSVVLETNRQFGAHAMESGKIDCNRLPAQGTIPASPEFGSSTLSFGPPFIMSTNASHHRRLLFKSWSRTIHIYISMLGLLSVIFFSVTGIMLNHEEWFGFATPHVVKKEGSIPEAMAKEPDKLLIVEKLRKDLSATGALDSFEIEDDNLRLSFKSPGRHTDVTIQRADGHAEVSLESYGLSGRLVDLHRGTDAGPAWRFIIDATAVLLLITCATGMLLWCLVPKWRPLGLAALGFCLLGCIVVYFALVP